MPKWLKWLLGITIIVAAVALSIVTVGIAAPITTALGGGVIASIAISGFGLSVGMQGITNGFDNINWGLVGKDTLVGTISGFISGGIFGGIKKLLNAEKVANSLSGVSRAMANADDAALAFKMTPLIESDGSMAAHNIAANVAKFSFVNLYRFGNFGLKQLIGYGIKGRY